MSDRTANIILGVRNQSGPAFDALAGSFRDLIAKAQQSGASLEQAERKALSHASALAQLATRSGNAAAGERTLAAALSVVDSESTAAVRAQAQLVGIQQRIAQEAARAGQALRSEMDAMRASIQSVQGPANGLIETLQSLKNAAGGIGLAFGAQQLASFEVNAVKSALSLRETQNALRAVAGSTQLYNEALATAKRQQILFGGSLQENIDGIQGLTIVSRSTGAELQRLIDLTQRLSIKSPEQGIGGARLALGEALEEGNITSLSRRFEIPREALERLKNTALPVGERLKVIDDELNRIGITSEAVAGKIDADAVAIRQLGANAETIKNALGNQLATEIGPTVAILGRLSGAAATAGDATGEGGQKARAFTAAFSESTPIFGTLFRAMHLFAGEEQNAAAAAEQLAAGQGRVSNALAALIPPLTISSDLMARMSGTGSVLGVALDQLTGKFQAVARETIATNAASDLQAAKTALVTARTNEAVESFLRFHPNINAVGAALLVLAGKADPAIVKLALLRAEADRTAIALAGLTGGGPLGTVEGRKERDTANDRAELGRISGQIARETAQKQIAEAKRVHDAQLGLDLASAKTSAQRIAILQRELSATTDIAERLRIQTQIQNERNSGARAHTSELDKQLSLNERIADSQAKQARAAIDARLALIDDAKQRILEQKELATAQNAARNAKDPRFRALADLAAQRIPLEQAQRALDIQEKLATAGGDIVKGRIIQGQRGAVGTQNLASLPPIGPIPQLPTLPGGALPSPATGAGGGGFGGVDVKVYIDSQEVAARVVTTLRGGLQQTNAGGGRG